MPTQEQMFSPEYWADRLRRAQDRGELDKAVFEVGADIWSRICTAHRGVLAHLIAPDDSILDAACGWGRLLTLMPKEWDGGYLGVDIAPAFIELARVNYPDRYFMVGDLRYSFMDWIPGGLQSIYPKYDWGIIGGTRPMIRNNAGPETWERIESNLRRWCRRLLFLEYDEANPYEVKE